MDKAAIFADITRRNALRKANGLPLLDVPAEYAREVSLAGQRDYQAICDEHADEREAIRQQALAEYQAKYGPQFGQTMGGRWAVGHLTHRRFMAFMAERYAVFPPIVNSPRNAITYGGSDRNGE